ncbi:Transcription initiation factor TFIID subunit 8 [Fasciolopsis buskii]|uniref:Transcription initiation factor TFIID subunit 8 n=1 Tax=Fasciolopsis buskii TaxID=27845 RepID=A0A8E0RPU6_9TREM|nr:Transcription initiation factor TFIID subunit 8 [Fasciolopsis buski]
MANRLLTGGECPQGVLDVIEGAVGYLALSNGFSAIEYAALRILSNMFLSFIEELGVASLMNAESSGRTTIMLSDLIVALVDFGFNLKGLSEPSRRRQYRGFKEPSVVGSTNARGVSSAAVIGPSGATIIPRPLSLRSDWPSSARGLSGNAQSSFEQNFLPPPAPAHLQLPALPEPHTFLQTWVKRPPVSSDPASLRRRLSEQRRKVQQSFIRFLARINPVQYLFPGDPESFMLVTPKKNDRPYLRALLTQTDTMPTEDNENTTNTQAPPKSKPASSVCTNAKTATSNPTINPYLLKPKFLDY